MKIIYWNNCWFTNVGEAFIDIGGMELTKQIFSGAQIGCLSPMSHYYVDNVQMSPREIIKKHFSKSNESVFQIEDYLSADYVILAGMFATKEYLELNKGTKIMIEKLLAKGSKIIFWGLGGLEYNNEEISSFSRYLEKINPTLVVTRDKETFDNYKNVANCISGIDCAFWINDVFNPKGFADSSYDVVAFNRSEEPSFFQKWEKTVVRPWHMQFSFRVNNFKNNMMISDTPYDYLTLYANAEKVYTDLVHASIVSLMYGVPVKYWYIDGRSNAFHALNNLRINQDGFMHIDAQDLKKQKQEIIAEIKNTVLK